MNSVHTIFVLGTTQTLAWASSYYLPAVLAAPMAADLGTDASFVHLCFSAALLVAALVGPPAGRRVDRHGGRALLPLTNLMFALGLLCLALAQGPWGLLGAWFVLGIAMGFGLYDAAFAALVFLYGTQARKAMTGMTLIAGFASTIGWPLTTVLESAFGWRGAVLAWALLHLGVGTLLNRRIPDRVAPETGALPDPASLGPPPTPPNANRYPRYASIRLVVAFAATGFVGTAMAAHLPAVVQAAGASLALAISSGALIGPAQVGARLLQFGPLGRLHPLWSAWIADLAHPLAVLALVFGGPAASMLFAIVHGLGSGTQTIARGTVPLALFGAEGYGERIGKLLAFSRFTQALAPWLFGLALARWGIGALWISFLLCLVSIVALLPFWPAIRRIDPSVDSQGASRHSRL